MKKRVSILAEAQAIVNGPRRKSYGPPEDNFVRWRDLCQASGRPGLAEISCEDLATAMVLLKVARDAATPKRDNSVDGAGYFEILDLVRGL